METSFHWQRLAATAIFATPPCKSHDRSYMPRIFLASPRVAIDSECLPSL